MKPVQKIAISISMMSDGTFKVEVLGIDGAQVVGSEPELEKSGLAWGSAVREMTQVVQNVAWRKTRGMLELVQPSPSATVKVQA